MYKEIYNEMDLQQVIPSTATVLGGLASTGMLRGPPHSKSKVKILIFISQN